MPDLDISLTARPAQVSIIPGEPTQVWQYHAAVHTGNKDRTFDRDNQLIYTTGHPMEQMTGFLGDAVLVNGRPDPTLSVSTGTYRQWAHL
ncbi:MAG: hypothetical protein K9N10_17055 [Deltaproteobacteria bacterium]|nr:hypothetical protein [Deltaproteobacteria bacterium]